MKVDDLYVGKRCLWRHTPRGGYGFVIRVPVTIRKLTSKRAVVLVESCGKIVTVSRNSLIDPPTMRGVKIEVEQVIESQPI